MPPDTRRGPALDRPDLHNVDHYDDTDNGTRRLSAPAVTLGRRLELHEVPEVAAALLRERFGPLGAARWLRLVLEEVGR